MNSTDRVVTALRIWFVTVVLTSIMIGVSVENWALSIPLVLIGTIITLPVPLVASICIKLAFQISHSFVAKFCNTCFLLVLLAGLFWAIIIAMIGDVGSEDVKVIVGLNLLSLLVACVFSIKQLKALNDVTSEETVVS